MRVVAAEYVSADGQTSIEDPEGWRRSTAAGLRRAGTTTRRSKMSREYEVKRVAANTRRVRFTNDGERIRASFLVWRRADESARDLDDRR
jgi:hypothetical protein